jgi:hypothetical protein
MATNFVLSFCVVGGDVDDVFIVELSLCQRCRAKQPIVH